MRFPIGICVCFCLSFVAVHLISAAQPPPPVLKAGFADRDITPDIGMEQPGGYGKSYHRTLHDPCKVRAAVFDDGQARVAIVGIDALFVHRQTVLNVRREIEKQCGIPADSILISASHSHSSGPMSGVMPGEFDFASPLVQSLAYEKSTCANAAYLEHVERQIVDAVCSADRNRVEVRAGVGRGIEDQVAYNRRFRMRNGFSATHPGQGNPDIVEPAGPVDPEVGVLGAWDGRGKMLGCIVNFACHATTSPGGISANYIHDLEKVIRGYFGQDAVVVFLPGASGDITQVDNLSPVVNRAADNWCRYVGGRIGAEAVKVLLAMDTDALAPVKSVSKLLHIQRRVPSPDRVQKCLELLSQEQKKVDATEWTFAKEIVLLDARLSKEPVVEVEVQALQIGPAVFLSDPAEYFCQFGLDIKADSRFPFTFPVELANGCVGYVPTEEALGPRGGGYETRLTSYSNLEPTAGRQMADAAIELAGQLQPGPVPTRQPAAPFHKGPWSYGLVPPELK